MPQTPDRHEPEQSSALQMRILYFANDDRVWRTVENGVIFDFPDLSMVLDFLQEKMR